jgi:tRNA A-37 threonylcarbamoyl transferase component Bud32
VNGAGLLDAERVALRIRELTGQEPGGPPRILDDTTEFMGIDRGDVIRLGDELLLVRGVELEKRFGLTGEPKYWVKRAISLTTGRPQIVKLVFAEVFRARVGDREFLCRRSAEKEARVLELTRGDLDFMQGRAARDANGNLVRVLDVIRGQDLLTQLGSLEEPHEAYVRSTFPAVLARVVDALRAIARLHAAGLCHGDIRNDHLFVDADSGRLRWIDFDLDPGSPEFDLWSVGNILHVVAARRVVRIRDVLDKRPELAGRVGPADASLFFPYRLMNLGALYPWLPQPFTEILRRFAVGDCPRYRTVDEVADELQAVVEGL